MKAVFACSLCPIALPLYPSPGSTQLLSRGIARKRSLRSVGSPLSGAQRHLLLDVTRGRDPSRRRRCQPRIGLPGVDSAVPVVRPQNALIFFPISESSSQASNHQNPYSSPKATISKKFPQHYPNDRQESISTSKGPRSNSETRAPGRGRRPSKPEKEILFFTYIRQQCPSPTP